MSLKDNNIEELFRSRLEDFELPVNDVMWNSISNQVSQSAVSAASKSIFGLSTKTFILATIGVSALVVGGIMLANSIKSPENVENKIVEPQQNVIASTDTTFEKSTSSKSEYIELLNNLSKDPSETAQNSEVSTSNPPKKNIVTVTPKGIEYKSVAQMFLSPPNKNVNYGTSTVDNKTSQTNANTSNNSNSPSSLVEVKIEEVKPEQIIASISAMPVGGFAPLEVSFMQQSNCTQIHWDFGDGKQSKEAKPTHIFEKFGKYTVTLTLLDNKGKQFKDTRIIEVLANSAITNIPNIFTPNNDGQNDSYFIEGKNIEEFNLMIMDIKGNLIHQSKNIEEKWSGITLTGNLITEGKYVVILVARGTDGKVFEFNTTLIIQ
jgi:gliding motility-associated-like protein